MTTFLVVDNVLSADEMLATYDYFKDLRDGNSTWVDKDSHVLFPLEKIISIVSKTFDLSNALGYECWSHLNTRASWHVDKDETAWITERKLMHPLCSIVYYPLIKNMTGGRFVTKSHLVVPRENRLIAFSPALQHAAEIFKGERMSCAINPWTYKPASYSANDNK